MFPPPYASDSVDWDMRRCDMRYWLIPYKVLLFPPSSFLFFFSLLPSSFFHGLLYSWSLVSARGAWVWGSGSLVLGCFFWFGFCFLGLDLDLVLAFWRFSLHLTPYLHFTLYTLHFTTLSYLFCNAESILFDTAFWELGVVLFTILDIECWILV